MTERPPAAGGRSVVSLPAALGEAPRAGFETEARAVRRRSSLQAACQSFLLSAPSARSAVQCRDMRAPETTAILNGTAVLPDREVRDALVLIEGERLTYAGANEVGRIPEGARRVDAAGGFILPG